MRHLILTLLSLLLLVGAGLSQQPLPLFADTLPLNIRIEADFKDISRDKGEKRDYHEATIFWEDGAGGWASSPVRIIVRGNFRRNRCSFPPLRLNFDKDSMDQTLFEGINKLKLVTHCNDKRARYEQIVLQEHIIYQAYAAIAPVHFKTRLAQITYVDTKKADTVKRWGLFVEPTSRMADRYQYIEVEVNGIRPEATDYNSQHMLYMFEYLVGNTDFSIPFQHNVKLVTPDPNTAPIPVPYDWDICGWVDPPYAPPPNPILNITSIRERKYRGFCRPRGEYNTCIQHFLNQKSRLYDIINKEPGLDEKVKESMIKYLDEYYKIVEDPDKVDSYIVRDCRKL